MTTVRQARIYAAMDALDEQIGLGRLAHAEKGLRRRACVEVTAEAIVDVLFPDHLLDNIEIPDH